MQVVGHDPVWDDAFAAAHGLARAASLDEAVHGADVISLHMSLGPSNRRWLDRARIATLKRGALVINTARGGLVDEDAVADACVSGALGGYGTDVLEHEPQTVAHRFTDIDNIVVTPHVGSRTFESVERQGLRAARNIVNYLSGNADFIRANGPAE
jgi:D-3-phosphoglycerate dehydrogenase